MLTNYGILEGTMEILLPLLLIPSVVNTLILSIVGKVILNQIDVEREKTKVELKKIHAKLNRGHTVD